MFSDSAEFNDYFLKPESFFIRTVNKRLQDVLQNNKA